MNSEQIIRAPPPWRWSLAMLAFGLVLLAIAELQSGVYAWATSGDPFDRAAKIGTSCAGGLIAFGGAIITVWLLNRKRLRMQAMIAGFFTVLGLVLACWNLAAAKAYARQQREAPIIAASPSYAAAKTRLAGAEAALLEATTFDNEAIIKARIAALRAEVRRGETPLIGDPGWVDWLAAILQHGLALGVGAAFRLPPPAKQEKANRDAKRPKASVTRLKSA